MAPTRVLVYTDARIEGATFQIRIAGPLNDAGVQVVHADGLSVARLPRVFHDEVDALIIHRGTRKRCPLYAPLIRNARLANKPILFDVDDLLIDVPDSHPDFEIYRGRALQNLKVMLDADLVVASTTVLADHLRAFHPGVTVIPNRMPKAGWSRMASLRDQRRAAPEDSPFTIGYIGTHTHAPDLASIEDALLRVLDRYAGRAEFLVVGLQPSAQLGSHPAVRHLEPPRSARKAYLDFAAFASELPLDIAVAPLLDLPFNRCKSDIKFQEYSALGIPGIYSDIPPYCDAVVDGRTGLLATGEDDWVDAIERLLESPEFRQNIAADAHEQIGEEVKHSGGQSWIDAFERAGELARSPAVGARRATTARVMDSLLAYQTGLERQLKRTVEHQVTKAVQRLVRKIA